MKTLMTALLVTLLSVSAWAQNEINENTPGYVDFGSLDAIYGEPRVMINIGGPLMQIMALAAKNSDDPEAAALMGGLEGVRVNIYNTDGNLDPALAQMGQAKAALEAAQWQPIIQVREEAEYVQMFSRIEGDKMQGMAIMVVNAEEAVFLNILGIIDPSQVGRVMDQLNVDVDVDGE
jgi:uncharacterized protein DUF4252